MYRGGLPPAPPSVPVEGGPHGLTTLLFSRSIPTTGLAPLACQKLAIIFTTKIPCYAMELKRRRECNARGQ